MTQRVKLDRIDRMILTHLQDDGRMTNVDLARRVGISAPPCLRRVRALEEAGFIRGYHAELDAAALGYHVTVFAQVGLNSQAESDLRAFEERVQTWPEVRECHMLAGETDFLLKIVAHDWDDYQRFLTAQLTPAPNVSHVKTALAIRTSKLRPGVPVLDPVAEGGEPGPGLAAGRAARDSTSAPTPATPSARGTGGNPSASGEGPARDNPGRAVTDPA